MIFNTTDTSLKHLNGQYIVLIATVPLYRLDIKDVGPMYCALFPCGKIADIFRDEIQLTI